MSLRTSCARPMARQSRAALRGYLDQIHAFGADLSMSASLAMVSPALSALSAATPDVSRQREDEPYRRALSGVYARLAATYEDFDVEAPAPPGLRSRAQV